MLFVSFLQNWEVGDKINGNIISVHCDVDFMKHLNNWRLQKFYCCCFLQTVYRDINIDGIQIQAAQYWQISVLHPIWMPMLEFQIQNSLGGQKLTSITIATDGCHGNRYSLSLMLHSFHKMSLLGIGTLLII